MKREWKPGHVAATEYRGVDSMALVVEGQTCPLEHPRLPHWHGVSGGWNPLDDCEVTYRPLVVIDPEDREQVERLLTAILHHQPRELVGGDRNVWNAQFCDALTAALREFANPTPPKPDEPTGLGAVVEDAAGRKWVRHSNAPGTFPWVAEGRGAKVWSEFEAVKVLSEGWSV